MDWEAKDEERKQKVAEEKKRLMGMSDADAEKLPVPERYQRIRYLREKESHEWLMDLRRKMPPPPIEPMKVDRRKPSNASVVKFRKWED